MHQNSQSTSALTLLLSCYLASDNQTSSVTSYEHQIIMSGTSNVGGAGVYEAKDQRTVPDSEKNKTERYEEGKENSHSANDPSMYPILAQ